MSYAIIGTSAVGRALADFVQKAGAEVSLANSPHERREGGQCHSLLRHSRIRRILEPGVPDLMDEGDASGDR
jgi:predicted dinucleotide-binding enzyme